jgi:sugar lactone lactonase YvrE
MKHAILLFGLLAGCHCASVIGPPGDSSPETEDSQLPPGDSDTGPETGDPQEDCTDPAPLPVQATTLRGFPPAEDFALDGEGRLVAIDEFGNLVATSMDGERQVILPGAGAWTSGMHMLQDGSFVYSDAATGSLMRVRPGGGAEVVVAGMSYPNGIEVDLEGYVYVSEHDAGRVRRIDPESGAYDIIATGLHHPNGLQFSTDYQTLHIGSFGGGTVHSVQREDASAWSSPRLLGYVPSIDVDSIPEPCEGAAEGDACIMLYGGVGTCAVGDDDALGCELTLDVEACGGLNEDDPCTTDFLGTALQSRCVQDDDISPDLFCPRAEAERVESCHGSPVYSTCRVQGEPGYCVTGWEGVNLCQLEQGDWLTMREACDGLDLGDPCTALFPTGPWQGSCGDFSHWGMGVACGPWYGWGETGGLDGIAVDACDNVYVTEYISGEIFRFSPDGAEIELVYATGAFWIPNMHWGNGVGGWEPNVLYVLNRDRGDVHALQVDIHGVVEAYQP